MSVILDALKRVQDESRRRMQSDSDPDDPRAREPRNSDAMLQRMAAGRSATSGSPGRSFWDVSPALWVVLGGVAVLALVALARWWFFPPMFQLQPLQEQPPLLSELLGREIQARSVGEERSPGLNRNDPGALVGVVPRNTLDGTIENGSEPDAMLKTDPPGPISDNLGSRPVEGPDLSDLSAQLSGQVASIRTDEPRRAGDKVVQDRAAEGSFLEPTKDWVRSPGSGKSSLDSTLLHVSPVPQRVATTNTVPATGVVHLGVSPAANKQLPSASQDGLPQRLVDPGLESIFHEAVQLHKLGDLVAAEAAYHRALELDPQNAKVNANLGVLYESLDLLREAEAYLRASLAVEPDNAPAHNNLGVVLYRSGDYDNGLIQFKRALTLNPASTDAYSNIGLTYTRWGDYQKAEDAFKQVLSRHPGHALTHYNLGLVYEEQGALDRAMKTYRNFLAINSGQYPEISQYLGQHLERLEARWKSMRPSRLR